MDEPGDPLVRNTRRGWLNALARNARQQLQERAEGAGPRGLQALLLQIDPATYVATSDPTDHSAADSDAARRPASAPDRALSVQELIALAHAEGLAGHDDALRALTRRSLRMTAVTPDCAEGWIHTTDEWIATPGSEVLLAQIDLAATRSSDAELPTDGWLVLFAGTDAEPSGREGFHAHAVVLEHPAEAMPGSEPVALRPELALPRLWNDAVQALGIDQTAADAYARIRSKLQDLQGVERDDEGGPLIAYHRLLGYPDETTGTMPSECAGPASDPTDWRLLVQVSVGDVRRAYLWIREANLTAGRIEDLRLFVR